MPVRVTTSETRPFIYTHSTSIERGLDTNSIIFTFSKFTNPDSTASNFIVDYKVLWKSLANFHLHRNPPYKNCYLRIRLWKLPNEDLETRHQLEREPVDQCIRPTTAEVAIVGRGRYDAIKHPSSSSNQRMYTKRKFTRIFYQ